MRRFVLVFLLVAALLALPANAQLDSEQYEMFGAGEVDEAIPDSARDVIGDVGVAEALEPEGMFSQLWDSLLDKLGELWSQAAAGAVKLVAVAALVSMCSAFSTVSR